MVRVRGMLFAKVDLCFWRDKKFRRAGLEASGYWSSVLTWLREDQTEDGIIPFDQVGAPHGVGPEVGLRMCEILTSPDVGLFAKREHGYELLLYREKGNETRSDIVKRRKVVKKRVDAHRASNADVTRYRSVTEPSCNAVVPDSVSDSVSDSFSSLREGVGRVPADPPALTVVPGPAKVRNPTDAGVGHVESTLWAEGCRLAGRPVSDPDRFAREVIAKVANAQSPVLQGQQMADWIRESSRSYAAASVGHEDFWPLTVPRWKAWVESGSKPIQAAGPRKAIMQATPPDAPWLRGLT